MTRPSESLVSWVVNALFTAVSAALGFMLNNAHDEIERLKNVEGVNSQRIAAIEVHVQVINERSSRIENKLDAIVGSRR